MTLGNPDRGDGSGMGPIESSSSTPSPDKYNLSTNESPPRGSGSNPNTYANIAAMAIKSGPLARIGKALYGGVGGGSGVTASVPASPSYYSGFSDTNKRADTAGASPASSSSGIANYPDAPDYRDEDGDEEEDDNAIKYTAHGGIFAMASSPSKSHVAIVGKDFFQVLNVSNNDISVSHNVRGGNSLSSGSREFDKTFSVTALKWGFQSFSRYLALSNAGGRIFIYDAERGSSGTGIRRPILQLLDSTRNIHSLAFNPSLGYNLLSASSDGTVKLWDLRDNPRSPALIFIKKGGDTCREVQCSPFDGKKFAAIYDSGVIQRWDVRQPQTYDRRINAHSGAGQSLDWHSEKDYIVSGGRDQQLQVWNMSNDNARAPDHVLYTPSSVAKVRWLVDKDNGKNNDILNSKLISCGRNKGDNLICVWDIKRPYIPVNAIERHTDSITDICCRNDRYVWSSSKDKTFRQHDLLFEPLLISNLSSRAFTWSSSNDLLFISQEKDKPTMTGIPISEEGNNEQSNYHGNRRPSTSFDISSSPGSISGGNRLSASSQRAKSQLDQLALSYPPVICDVVFPGNDPNIFSYCAQHYQLAPGQNETIADVCRHNSRIAAMVNKMRTSQVWSVLSESVTDEIRRYQIYLLQPKQEPKLQPPPRQQQQPQQQTISNRIEPHSHNKHIQTNPPIQQSIITSKVFPEASAGIGKIQQLVTNSVTSHQAETGDAEKLFDTTTQNLANASIQPMSIPDGSGIGLMISSSNKAPGGNARNGINIGSNMNYSPSGHRYSFDLTGSSPDDSYGGLKEAAGASYTHISMLGSSVRRARNFSTSTHISSGTDGGNSSIGSARPPIPVPGMVFSSFEASDPDLVGKSIAEWKSRTLDDIKEDISDSSLVQSNTGGLGTPANSTGNLIIPGVKPDVSNDLIKNSVSSSKLSAALHRKDLPSELSLVGHSLSSSITTRDIGNNSHTSSKTVQFPENTEDGPSDASFKYFISTQTSPWRTEALVSKAAEYAMEQGDVQLCAVLAAIFLQTHPNICDSPRVAEEWIISYVGILKRQSLFTAAASLSKISKFKSVRKLAMNDTTLDTLCHHCRTPLSENASLVKEKIAKINQLQTNDRLEEYDEDDDLLKKPLTTDINEIGYYYCQTCQRLLDGCTLCRCPIRGLALVLLECGHKAHPLCLKEWVFQDGMVECPSGCGTSLVR